MSLYYKGPTSDHFDGNNFFNPIRRSPHFFLNFLRWQFTSASAPWSNDIYSLLDEPPQKVEGKTLRVSFIGHSTVLIQTNGYNILTDPIWSQRASPLSWIGPKRVCDAGILFDKLPKIDIVLISHNHYDHLDKATLTKIWLRDHPQIITPLGNDTIIRSFHPSIESDALDWHQSIKIDDNVTITLQPVQHWSSRGFRDRDHALWGAFLIQAEGGNIYFAGDSGYGHGEHFRNTGLEFGPMRFSIIPIGTFEPYWFMKYGHMNPEEAVKAFIDLHSIYGMAIHFATFKLSDESYDLPIQLFKVACRQHEITKNRFRTLYIGESWIVPEIN